MVDLKGNHYFLQGNIEFNHGSYRSAKTYFDKLISSVSQLDLPEVLSILKEDYQKCLLRILDVNDSVESLTFRNFSNFAFTSKKPYKNMVAGTFVSDCPYDFLKNADIPELYDKNCNPISKSQINWDKITIDHLVKNDTNYILNGLIFVDTFNIDEAFFLDPIVQAQENFQQAFILNYFKRWVFELDNWGVNDDYYQNDDYSFDDAYFDGGGGDEWSDPTNFY